MKKLSRDLRQGKAFLLFGYSSAIVSENSLRISLKKGVVPLLDYLSDGLDLSKYSLADKIIGKAAASLVVFGGFKEVYAEKISEAGRDYFLAHHVVFYSDELVPMVYDRTGKGMCPFEKAVEKLEDPAACKAAIEATLVSFRKK